VQLGYVAERAHGGPWASLSQGIERGRRGGEEGEDIVAPAAVDDETGARERGLDRQGPVERLKERAGGRPQRAGKTRLEVGRAILLDELGERGAAMRGNRAGKAALVAVRRLGHLHRGAGRQAGVGRAIVGSYPADQGLRGRALLGIQQPYT
jgi:hypothetical protein